MIQLKEILGKALKSVKLGPAADLAVISSNWENIVGSQLVGFARPAHFSNKTLYIDVFDNAFMEPLEYSKEQIKKKVSAFIAPTKIEEVKFHLAERRE